MGENFLLIAILLATVSGCRVNTEHDDATTPENSVDGKICRLINDSPGTADDVPSSGSVEGSGGRLDPASLPEHASRVCGASNGHWHNALRTCMCGHSRSFHVREGCAPLATVLRQRRPGALDLGGRLLFEIRPEVEDIASDELDLSGYMYDDGENVGLSIVDVQTIRTNPLDQLVGLASQGPAWIMHTPHFVDSHAPDPRTTLAGTCGTLPAHEERGNKPGWANLCEAATALVNELRQDTLRPLPWVRMQMGPSEQVIIYDTAFFERDGFNILYQLVGKPGALNARIITISKDDKLLSFGVTPSGAVLGGRFDTVVAADSSEQHIYASHSIYFDGNFAPFAEQIHLRGDRDMMQQSIRHVQEAAIAGETVPLATDSRSPSMYAARVMILDDAIDLRIPGLAARFDLDSQWARRFVDTREISGALLWPDQEKPRGLVALAGDQKSSHGTGVAGVLLADFPLAKASIVDIHDPDFLAPQRLRDALYRRIASERPRVVNISLSFAPGLADCAEVFDPLFEIFAQDVLFVVAAGNFGELDAPDICPASLAHKHPNVLSVAGIDEAGKIHPSSNWGPTLTQVAAPFCVNTIDPLAESSVEARLVKACGTSFSAPTIANKALWILAAEPELTAPELAGRLRHDERRRIKELR